MALTWSLVRSLCGGAGSLLSTFAAANHAAFHKADGSGYRFVAEQVVDLDARNPQVAARLASSFNTWRRHSPSRQALMKAALETIKERYGED